LSTIADGVSVSTVLSVASIDAILAVASIDAVFAILAIDAILAVASIGAIMSVLSRGSGSSSRSRTLGRRWGKLDLSGDRVESKHQEVLCTEVRLFEASYPKERVATIAPEGPPMR
jgi:hypothetical protein